MHRSLWLTASCRSTAVGRIVCILQHQTGLAQGRGTLCVRHMSAAVWLEEGAQHTRTRTDYVCWLTHVVCACVLRCLGLTASCSCAAWLCVCVFVRVCVCCGASFSAVGYVRPSGCGGPFGSEWGMQQGSNSRAWPSVSGTNWLSLACSRVRALASAASHALCWLACGESRPLPAQVRSVWCAEHPSNSRRRVCAVHWRFCCSSPVCESSGASEVWSRCLTFFCGGLLWGGTFRNGTWPRCRCLPAAGCVS